MKLQIIVSVLVVIAIIIGVALLWEQIVLADFITQLVAGAVLLSPFIIIWGFKPLIEKFRKTDVPEKQYNAKKLNDEVFRKLMRVECLEDYFFFIDKFGFCIPTNPKAFTNKAESDYLLWSVGSRDLRDIQNNFDIIEREIPNLKIGENYLEQNHGKIYKKWVKIKEDLEKLNNDRGSLFGSISKKIGKEMKKQLGFETKLLLSPFGDEKIFFENEVKEILPLQFHMFNPHFEIENLCKNQYYVKYGNHRIAGINKEENIELEKIKTIFENIVNNQDLREKNNDFLVELGNLNRTIDKFCDQLESEVVNDIDARE